MTLLFSSLVSLSSTRTFLLARVQHCQPLSQSKFIPSEYCIRIMRESYACGLMTCINLSGGSRAPSLPSLFLDQTETRRAEKHFFNPPALSQGLDDRSPSYLKVWIRRWISPIKDNFLRLTHKSGQIVLNT